MTDRYSGFTVLLNHDTREDDAEAIVAALKMIKGVAAVTPIVSDYATHVAEQRRDGAWREALFSLADKGPETREGA